MEAREYPNNIRNFDFVKEKNARPIIKNRHDILQATIRPLKSPIIP
jgi:hypothetical protein